MTARELSIRSIFQLDINEFGNSCQYNYFIANLKVGYGQFRAILQADPVAMVILTY